MDLSRFSDLETFQTFYAPWLRASKRPLPAENGFLQWDLKVPGAGRGPDHAPRVIKRKVESPEAFYFTLRDALNFGQQEQRSTHTYIYIYKHLLYIIFNLF